MTKNLLPHTIARYKRAWRRNEIRDATAYELRRRRAVKEARGLALLMAKDYRIKKVILFGSANEPGRFSDASDIDLAVLGMKPEDYFPALGTLLAESEFEIDLVEYECAGALLKKRINRGKVLYEKQ